MFYLVVNKNIVVIEDESFGYLNKIAEVLASNINIEGLSLFPCVCTGVYASWSLERRVKNGAAGSAYSTVVEYEVIDEGEYLQRTE